MDNLWILAQADSQAGPFANRLRARGDQMEQSTTTAPGSPTRGPTDAPPRSRLRLLTSLLPLILIMVVVMYMLLFRGPRKQQQQQKQMVQSLKKNDRVRTIGGIYRDRRGCQGRRGRSQDR